MRLICCIAAVVLACASAKSTRRVTVPATSSADDLPTVVTQTTDAATELPMTMTPTPTGTTPTEADLSRSTSAQESTMGVFQGGGTGPISTMATADSASSTAAAVANENSTTSAAETVVAASSSHPARHNTSRPKNDCEKDNDCSAHSQCISSPFGGVGKSCRCKTGYKWSNGGCVLDASQCDTTDQCAHRGLVCCEIRKCDAPVQRKCKSEHACNSFYGCGGFVGRIVH